jgi:hypothetical protein
MTVVAGKKRPHAEERSKRILREIKKTGMGTEAECIGDALIDLMDQGLESNWQASCAILARVWRPDRPSRGPLSPEELKRVCEELREVRDRWRMLEVGQSMTFHWAFRINQVLRPGAYGDTWVASR